MTVGEGWRIALTSEDIAVLLRCVCGTIYVATVFFHLFAGLGSVSILSDELVLGVLEHMEAADLARLAMVSRACFAFAFHDELWRAIVLTQMEGTWKFHQNWRVCPLCMVLTVYLPLEH